MTKAQNTKALVEAVGGVIADEAPNLIVTGLNKLAREQSDPLAAGVLKLLSGFVATHGTEAIHMVATDIQGLLDGDPLAIQRLRLQGASAKTLTQMTDELQDAEAKRKRAASKLAAHVGAALADMVSFVSKAAIAALSA